jgi:hypothetical protein
MAAMRVIPLETTAVSANELAEMAKEGPVILTRNDQPVVAIKDISSSDRESVALSNNPRFIALIEESRRSYRERGGISLDDLRQELGLKTQRRRPAGRDREEGT